MPGGTSAATWRPGRSPPARGAEFYVLTPVFATGMFLVVLANSLGVMWIAVEATALSSVLLVALYNRRTSLEAAWKYVMLGSLGLALALFGTVFIYAAAVARNALRASAQLQLVAPADRGPAAGPAPDQPWRLSSCWSATAPKPASRPCTPGCPTRTARRRRPPARCFPGVSLKVAVYALLRFHILTTACLGTGFSRHLLLGFGLLSMFLAGPFILVQTNLKRMLAYSSLEHVGLICVAVGMNTPLTIFGALLHMGYHALTKPVLFFAAGNIHQHLPHAGFPADRPRVGPRPCR